MKEMTRTTRQMIITIALVIIALFAGIATAEASTEYTNVKAAGQEVLSGINSHKAKIEIKFQAKTNDGNALAKNIFNKATNLSEISDYIKYGVYNGYKTSWSRLNYGDGMNHYTITYKMNYKLTKAESNKFENRLSKRVRSLNLNGKSNKAKIKKIYKWITKNVKYDRKSNGTKKYTAYAALINKKAVCQGYAVLFYRMCKEAGVDAKVITGTSNGENHAWNIAKVGKKYFNLDSTWDAGKVQKNYKYFLKGNKTFKNHNRSTEYNSNAFYNAFPMAR